MFTEALAPAETILLAETMNNTEATYSGASLAMTPIDGSNTGYSYHNCDLAHATVFSPAREFLNLSWRHTRSKFSWCDPPPNACVSVAYTDRFIRFAPLPQLADFRQWALRQGDGDVGAARNPDG